MSSVNSVRIPGLATGMDTDQMIKDMLTGEQSKVDKVEQKKQISKWQQESYRDIIKNVKGFYDKYFSATSPDFILGSKTFSSTTINSSNGNVISATSGAGASNINYKFKVEQMAKPPKLESIEVDPSKNLGDLGFINRENGLDGKPKQTDSIIKINDKEITISSEDKVADLVEKINKQFPKSEVKASYSEMTGKLSIESKKTGISSELKFEGKIFKNMNMATDETGTITGSNNKLTIYENDGITKIKDITQENNAFTIDNVTYSINGITTGNELVSLTSQKDTKPTVEKMKSFIDEYNKMIDTIYNDVTQKKNRDYTPLTEAQRKDMSEEEIEKWEKKAKEGILRNDNELRGFMDDIKSAIFSPIGNLGVNLSDIGIKTDDDYNKQGQLHLDVEKFTKALEENGELVYKVTTGAFEKIKDVTYKYAGNSNGVFVKKAGIEKSSTEINNIFSEQIRKQEEQVKNLTRKMKDKEKELYSKFARLETNMNKLNSQMNYLMSSMGV